MKKLISLIFVALISSQMWAATQTMKVYFIYDDGGLTTKDYSIASVTSVTPPSGYTITNAATSGTTNANKYYTFTVSGSTPSSAKFTITISAASGWEPVKWVKGKNKGDTQIGTAGSSTLTASKSDLGTTEFALLLKRQEITISATSAGNGTGQISKTNGSGYTSSVSVTPSTTVYLKATPSSSSYVFDYWSNNQNSTKIYDASTSVTPSVATTYTAHFKAAPAPSTFSVSLSVSPEGAGVVSASPASSISSGGSSTLSVTSTTSGYTFDGWYENNSKLSGNSSYTLSSITANRTIVARFTPAPVNYTANPGENVMQCGTGITIPNIANAVDLGFGVLWAKKNVGASSVDYRGTRYTYAAAKALSASDLGGTGWRLPTYDEFSSSGLLVLDTHVDGNNFVFTRATGYNGVELIIATEGANLAEIWSSYESGNTRRVGRANRNTNTWTCINNIDMSTQASYEAWVRPVFDLAAAGIKKLTINVVKDGVTTTNNYYVANGQVVNITPASVSGYNSSWTSGASGTGTKTFTVTANTTATITYVEDITYVTATFNDYNGTQLYQNTSVQSGTTPTYGGSSVPDYTAGGYTYRFNGTWSPALGTITADETYTAQYDKYVTATFQNEAGETVGSVLVRENTAPSDADGISGITGPAKTGTTDGYTYTFDTWKTSADVLYTVAITDHTTYLPAYTRDARELTLEDKGNDAYYQGIAEEYYDENTPVYLRKITYNRSFPALKWSTFSLPFNWTIDEDSPLDGIVYSFDGATGDYTSLNVSFSAGVTVIEAGVPYLLYPTEKLDALVFDLDNTESNTQLYLTDAIINDGDDAVSVTVGTGQVTFSATNRGYTLYGQTKNDAVNETWKDYLFLSNNRLYYPNRNGNTLYAFRAFFHVNSGAGVAPRMRITANGQTIEIDEADANTTDEQSAARVRKTIENGVLIIERNGNRYNAQGAMIQ